MKKSIFKNKLGLLILAAFISIAGFYGCGESTISPMNNLSFSSTSSMDSTGDSQTYFILDTVKILIKDIKLNVANSSQDSTNFKVGPFVLFLNLLSSVNQISTAIIPAGTYDKIKFEIHKLDVNEPVPDPEFADALGRYSVIVKGWYYGSYFVFKSDKSAHQKISFPNTLQLTESVFSNVTLVVKPYIWFIKNGQYLDPRDNSNASDIEKNIKENFKNNFKVFRDNDRNGIPD